MREKRIDYKTKHVKGLMFKGSKALPKVVVTEEDKALRLKIMKLENKLNRIQGKIMMGFKVREVEKKRVPLLKARIEHLKKKLFMAEKRRLDRERLESFVDNHPEKE